MDQITNFLRLHLHDIAISMIATLLVIFGSDINRFIRQLVKKQHNPKYFFSDKPPTIV